MRTRNKAFQFFTGDINYLDYGGTWMRQLPSERIGERKRFHFIRLINWEDSCGRDAPPETYNVSLSEVSLEQISPDRIRQALECCDNTQETDLAWVACACLEYGLHAPLLDLNGNNWKTLYNQCATMSTRIEKDSAYRYEKMNRPVNKIGSTAAEFMRGDIFSGLERGVIAGDENALLIAKIYQGAARSHDTEED